MTETIKELHPVARKPHRCDWCGGIIEKGEQYVRHTLKYENEQPYDWCSHKDCDEIVGVAYVKNRHEKETFFLCPLEESFQNFCGGLMAVI